MLIWLGKQWLGQRDNPNPSGSPDTLSELLADFRKQNERTSSSRTLTLPKGTRMKPSVEDCAALLRNLKAVTVRLLANARRNPFLLCTSGSVPPCFMWGAAAVSTAI
jgi:hypothetical protein